MKKEETIYVLGDGPFAGEVIGLLADHYIIGNKKIVSIVHGGDELVFPSLIAIGIANPTIKRRVIEEFYQELEDEVFVSAISPMIMVAGSAWHHVKNSRAITIGPFTSIGHDTVIHDYVSICSNVTVGHDCTIGEYSTLCPGAIISGNVFIGGETFIGTGAVVKNGVSIGGNAVIGCGAVVIDNVEAGSVVAGNPAMHKGWRNY